MLLSGPPVGSGRLALSSAFVLLARFFLISQKRRRPRAPTQGPVFRRGDDPRTDLQAGIPKYVRFTWTWDRLLGIYYYILPIVSSCISFSALPPRAFDPQARASGRASTCRAGSPWGVALFYVSIILLLSGIRVEEDVDQKLHSTVTVWTVYVETVQSSHRLGWSTQDSEDADASCSALCFHCRRLDHVQSNEGDKSHNFCMPAASSIDGHGLLEEDPVPNFFVVLPNYHEDEAMLGSPLNIVTTSGLRRSFRPTQQDRLGWLRL